MFTVKQLARLAGVTPRALRHYDQIGLLKPSRLGENGYRYYGDESLPRLQQILFYRELDIPLEEIRKIVGRHDFDILAALEGHKSELEKRIARLRRLIETVNQTILHIKGEQMMNSKQMFAGFSEAEQDKMAAEAEAMYDPEIVRESNRKWKAYSAQQKQAILDQGNRIYTEIVAAMPAGADSPVAQALIARWYQYMSDSFWRPNLEQLLALADGYVNDPRFRATFDAMHPQLAEFMRDAVNVYAQRQEGRQE